MVLSMFDKFVLLFQTASKDYPRYFWCLTVEAEAMLGSNHDDH